MKCWSYCLISQLALVAEPSNAISPAVSDNEYTSQLFMGTQARSISNNQDYEYATAPVSRIQEALRVMQDEYFEIWIGAWPTAIDWTAAVVNTAVTSTLTTLSGYLYGIWRTDHSDQLKIVAIEDQINLYFAHNTAFYFAENAFNIRNEAYDDMLWVVLGWLENVKFINEYSELRKERLQTGCAWHGAQYIAAFSHRARVFYDLASHGWDTKLCGGGMTWNPHLVPYKNAITNQLFISASIGMYLYSPGDDNGSPYLANGEGGSGHIPAKPHDERYLNAAIDAYAWLKHSNMTNELGLYVDGFHITDWSRKNTTGTGLCDERNAMVLTYNQGVILSGLRGLWNATGETKYLEDGHQLVQNVMNATGWRGSDEITMHAADNQWQGLGRAGILEDYCDHTGECSQDSQTFKGIYFDHLIRFCQPLPRRFAGQDLVVLHRQSCLAYGIWAEHNAQGALRNRDRRGRFGSFWGDLSATETSVELPIGAVDYRNDKEILGMEAWSGLSVSMVAQAEGRNHPLDFLENKVQDTDQSAGTLDANGINDRGRGRTVETQSSGLSVLRASWELNNL